jgi:hypothetical protein
MIDMSKLKINAIMDSKPVAMTIRMPPKVHQDLIAYAEALKRESGQTVDPGSLVARMLARFMETDRAFRKSRRQLPQAKGG